MIRVSPLRETDSKINLRNSVLSTHVLLLQVMEETVSSVESRLAMFTELLSCSQGNVKQLSGLAELLRVWPPFPQE